MEGADHDERAGGECCVGDALLYHHSQAESHRRHARVPQRRRRIVRVLPRQVVDGASVQIRVFTTTVHQAREHRHSDLRRRLLWHRLQWYSNFYCWGKPHFVHMHSHLNLILHPLLTVIALHIS